LNYSNTGKLFSRSAEISADRTLAGTIMKTKFECAHGCFVADVSSFYKRSSNEAPVSSSGFSFHGAIRSGCVLPGALGPELSRRQTCANPATAINHRVTALPKLLQLHPLRRCTKLAQICRWAHAGAHLATIYLSFSLFFRFETRFLGSFAGISSVHS
jgi:hypothetical protein